MAIDPRFYRIARGVNAGELADFLAAGLQGMAEAEIADFSQPQQSDAGMLTYVGDAAQLDGTGPAGVVITTAELAPRMTAATAVLSVDNPRLAFARAVGLCLADDALPDAETPVQAGSQSTGYGDCAHRRDRRRCGDRREQRCRRKQRDWRRRADW